MLSGGSVGIDRDLVLRRLLELEEAISELEEVSRLGKERFLADPYVRDAAKYRLITAIEAAISVCNHIVARLRKPPSTYSECFLSLGEMGIIESELAERLAVMAKFRNMLVHLYWKISDERVYDIISGDLGDLREFVREVAAYAERSE